eukprot:6806074-Alexandrium_andersonii.AAC.1
MCEQPSGCRRATHRRSSTPKTSSAAQVRLRLHPPVGRSMAPAWSAQCTERPCRQAVTSITALTASEARHIWQRSLAADAS